MQSRREFLQHAALFGVSPLVTRSMMQATRALSDTTTASAPLSILVLGGTGFIGPHLVRHAVARGHRVTIFTRGRRDAELPESVVRLQGDRNGQLQSLEGKRWDAVIDDSATNAEWVRQSTSLLKSAARAYLFTSSTGVYYPYLKRGLTESDPVLYEATDPKDGSAAFGVAKAQCERVTLDAFGSRGVVVRPTYIVGPGDTTDRFPYWPQRIARGGDILMPGKRDDPMQLIDVRDLAEFMITLLEQGTGGVYNVAGPRGGLTAHSFYETAMATLGSNAKVKPRAIYVDDYEFLAAHKIEEAIPWALLRGNDFGMMSILNEKAVAAGLSFRPLGDTLKDTLSWWRTVPEARQTGARFAITAEKETQALADWAARKPG